MAKSNWLLAGISLSVAILVLTLSKGLIKLVPVVCGIVVGYIVAVCAGDVDFAKWQAAPWFALPPALADFHLPQFAWEPFIFMITSSNCTCYRTYWRCLCGRSCGAERFRKRPRSASNNAWRRLGLSCCKFLRRTSCNYL